MSESPVDNTARGRPPPSAAAAGDAPPPAVGPPSPPSPPRAGPPAPGDPDPTALSRVSASSRAPSLGLRPLAPPLLTRSQYGGASVMSAETEVSAADRASPPLSLLAAGSTTSSRYAERVERFRTPGGYGRGAGRGGRGGRGVVGHRPCSLCRRNERLCLRPRRHAPPAGDGATAGGDGRGDDGPVRRPPPQGAWPRETSAGQAGRQVAAGRAASSNDGRASSQPGTAARLVVLHLLPGTDAAAR